MHSDPDKDNPNEPTGPSHGNADLVDDVLAQASGLTDELEAELGAAPVATGRPRPPAPEEVDKQLNQVESLLNVVRGEDDGPGGSEPDSSTPADDAVAAANPQHATASVSPDDQQAATGLACDAPADPRDLQAHLDDLIEADPDTDKKHPAEAGGNAAREASGQQPEQADSDVGDTSSESAASTRAAGQTQRQETADSPSSWGVSWLVRLRRVVAIARRAVLPMLEWPLKMLDWTDRPFLAVSFRVRRWIGFAALAILSASLGVIAFSWS